MEAYLDSGDRTVNKLLFDELHASAEEIADSTGVELSWERLDDRRAHRLGAYRSVDLDGEADFAGAKSWASTAVISLYQELNERMRTRAKAIRASVAADASLSDEGRGPLPSWKFQRSAL